MHDGGDLTGRWWGEAMAPSWLPGLTPSASHTSGAILGKFFNDEKVEKRRSRDVNVLSFTGSVLFPSRSKAAVSA